MKNLTSNQLRVMSALSDGEEYGLQIIKKIESDAGVKILLGSLYNLLASLERHGFVTSHWGESSSSRGGNRRRYYKLTGLGEQVLYENIMSFTKQWGVA